MAFVWGPIAGYYAKQLAADLTLTPMEDDSTSGIPFRFNVGFAVRRRDRALKDSLEQFIDAKAPEIRSLLAQFGIPTLPLTDTSSSGTAPAGSPR